MPRILRVYSFKEILFPSLLSGIALTFIILVAAKAPWNNDERLILTLMKLMTRPEVNKLDVVQIFLLGLPTILIFIMPMALLSGIIIGVGRMTLDREVRAIQTGGINLFSVFYPIVLFGATLSMFVAWLYWWPEPKMLEQSIMKGGKLLISEFTNLEPGRVYDELFSSRSGMHLHFDERDEASGRMQGVTLMLEPKALQSKEERDKQKDRINDRLGDLRRNLRDGKLTEEEYFRLEHAIKLQQDEDLPVMIFSREAAFDINPLEGRVELGLYEGSIHMLDPEKSVDEPNADESDSTDSLLSTAADDAPSTKTQVAQERDYAMISYGKLIKTENFGSPDTSKGRRIKSIPQLIEVMGDKSLDEDDRFEAKATMLERFSLSLACLMFSFIGLPLAIWIRPTGKSVGIILAAAVIFVYHLLMRTGYTMVTEDRAIGPLMMFSPNILCAVAGFVLWWRAIRR